MPIKQTNSKCWCGNADLAPFSAEYVRCPSCETLVARDFPQDEVSSIANDETDFYGKEYWLSHQTDALGLTSIEERSRTDLLDRCGHWLRTILKFHLPPGNLLDVGCSHGAFVALSALAGFKSLGLELSPWVVEYGQRTFKVPILQGPIENQGFEPASFDVITLFDVLEHLQDPRRTIQECARVLPAKSVLIIQTPRFPAGRTFEQLQGAGDPFLRMMLPDEHLFLFSEQSVSRLLEEVGLKHIQFESAPFAQYDMMVVASPAELTVIDGDNRWEVLRRSTVGRLLEAYTTQDATIRDLHERLIAALTDARLRLENVNKLEALLKESDASWLGFPKDARFRRENVKELEALLKESEAARLALQEEARLRLENANKLEILLKESEAARLALCEQLDAVQRVFEWVPPPIRKKIGEILARGSAE
jgi:2-polyprenyl-3-methyl-5-hydroxy-6-metoxy-1,4-benzoquinol methylase